MLKDKCIIPVFFSASLPVGPNQGPVEEQTNFLDKKVDDNLSSIMLSLLTF